MDDLDDFESPTAANSSSAGLVDNFLLPILRFRWLILLTTILGLGIGLYIAAVVPNTYLSTTKVLRINLQEVHNKIQTQAID